METVTDERLSELTDKLEEGIREIYSSGRYAEYLAAMSKFHSYSYGNAILILTQFPAATCVAGYTTWKKAFSRQVRAGEKGIRIIAPCPARRAVLAEKKDPATGQTLCGADGRPLTETQFISTTRYKAVTVFDVSQTEGKALPSIGASELSGDVEDFHGVYERLAAISPLPVVRGSVPGAAKGYASFAEQRIVLRQGMSPVQTIKTLVHEIAHAKLHDPGNAEPGQRKARSEKEVEAESVAYVVCSYFGIDTSEYSFGYIAGWSRGRELAELKASLDRIHSTSGELINAIRPNPRIQRQELPQERREWRKVR